MVAQVGWREDTFRMTLFELFTESASISHEKLSVALFQCQLPSSVGLVISHFAIDAVAAKIICFGGTARRLLSGRQTVGPKSAVQNNNETGTTTLV